MLLFVVNALIAQVGINADGAQPDPSAILDTKSTTSGFLPPRMNTAQRDAISSPATGLVIFNTDCNDLQLFNGSGWIPIGNSGTMATPGTISGNATPCVNAIGQTYTITALPGAVGYTWTVPVGSTINGGQGTTALTVTFGTTNGAIFVSGYGSCWRSLGSYLGITLSPLPEAPVAGTHIASATQIIWNWNTVQGATGYKWNTTNDYASATDMALVTTKTETGLTCNTAYTRYAWAYNLCGNATPVSLNQTTTACSSSCGSVTVNHIAGDIAPVAKTVTYGTVTNIPGETSKCWITSNLGADYQATAVDDATEASAGWYWQFNRKQGYKVTDAGTRTPNTNWITTISENSDWTAASDPCALTLGGSWRIPTKVEWTNVDVGGSWTDWLGPWNSGLKLHAAGYLFLSNGILHDRGIDGNYWSSNQTNANIGWYLNNISSLCDIITGDKEYGFTLRCIKETPESPSRR